MVGLGRALGAFVLMMAVGYVAMVVLVPAPSSPALHTEMVDPGQSAATRLSVEAQALVSPRPVGTLQ